MATIKEWRIRPAESVLVRVIYFNKVKGMMREGMEVSII